MKNFIVELNGPNKSRSLWYPAHTCHIGVPHVIILRGHACTPGSAWTLWRAAKSPLRLPRAVQFSHQGGDYPTLISAVWGPQLRHPHTHVHVHVADTRHVSRSLPLRFVHPRRWILNHLSCLPLNGDPADNHRTGDTLHTKGTARRDC